MRLSRLPSGFTVLTYSSLMSEILCETEAVQMEPELCPLLSSPQIRMAVRGRGRTPEHISMQGLETT